MECDTTLCRLFTFAVVGLLNVPSSVADDSVDDYYDLGGFHYEVSTDSPTAQKWFDRGLAMCFGFNHEEAVRCFEKALAADPGMPMARWGIAYAWGPNINNMLIEPEQMTKAEQTLQLAKVQAGSVTAKERQLIEALAERHETPMPESRDALNEAYAKAMREVYHQYQDDPLVVTLFAESLMNLQPWLHWSPEGEPGPHTQEIRQVIETGLKRWPEYPSLCHLYIHTMEASPTPEAALPYANNLRDAMPGQGHLLHMPTHIDLWVGDYEKVIAENQKAIVADKEFLRREGPLNFYSLYRIHNYHFLTYGAMFDGQSELALQAARNIKRQVPEEMLRDQVDFLDAFMPTDLHVLVRFGRWEEILQQPEPADWLPMSRAIWRYTRTLAYASTHRVEEAEAEQDAFEEAVEKVPETSFLFQNPSVNILGVAESMIAGEVAYRRGEFDEAFEHLREAVRRDDALNYDEPWGWMQPARHALGALLLEQEHYAEAEEVYRKDLELHPNNPWALHGLAECLEQQGRQAESASCRQQFTRAAKRTDVNITRSCYCKLSDDESAD